ncbi:CHAP domain-containing protein [Salinibacter altiplanensis]|uniref:CHAP domain-containing protein n=1 Tax=Salinibacter altiplanensis TaxID=1803181 RepID=UPI000C9F02A4|nr:CHAP domain-containing protein [Salinibacter altiplanensis]
MLDRLISKRVLFISALAALAAGAVAFTFTQAVAYSAFAAAVLKVAIILLLFEGLDRYLLEGVDTTRELKEGNVAVAVALLALALLLAPAVATGQPCPRADPGGDSPDRPAVVDVALQEVGVTETPPGTNEGPRIEAYMEAVGLPDGYPWCAGAVRWMMDQAETDRPTVRSAGATDYVTGASIEATDVLRGAEPVPAGALAIWRRGDTWKGHIGVVQRWRKQCGRTVEGNTSPGEAGPQRDGDGVWNRRRCIRPGSYFRIVAFTPTS